MKKDELINVWNDLVGIKDLAIAIILSVTGTMVGFFLAPANHSTKQLFFGLSGAVVAFLINTWIIKPKRNINDQNN
ncbi:hypothetical protein [uncultured Vagococcus sp.]|uniref:hypothetical protein n=1 Tax=uncultured Vagococcus sp. TaxID=189676 RepID=UPI0028CFEA0F|nr:hypothetical protein [uncultured Vagococcus sp.]